MLSIRNLVFLQKPAASIAGCQITPTRGLKIHPSNPPTNFTLPAKSRLPPVSKVPNEFLYFAGKFPLGTRESYRMRGEEKVHTDLWFGQYGIVAVHGGMVKTDSFDTIRSYTLKKMKKHKNCFAFYRVDPPYKPITTHGVGKKLGGGKGKIKHYVTPVRAGRVFMEVCGDMYWEEVKPWLRNITRMLPFEAIAVNKEILDELNKTETALQESNENPYTFEWMIRNNMMDCGSFLSPYDQKWFGRFVYKDRQYNKKWNLTRQSKYPGPEGVRGN